MLKIDDLSFSYTGIVKNLNDVSAELPTGQVIAVAGRNGSGKTTLTRIIMGLMNANSGRLILDGQDITATTAAERAAYIGYVFQNPDTQLFAGSVLEEVCYAPKQLGFNENELRDAVQDALEDTGLTGMEKQVPQLLSRGLKQCLSIASALAARPKILILDEPTTGQDCRERVKLLHMVKNLKQRNITVILVTHDMDIIAEHADKILVLERGILKFDGTASELFSDEEMTIKLGLELPEAVKVGRELGLPLCLTPADVYRHIGNRKEDAV